MVGSKKALRNLGSKAYVKEVMDEYIASLHEASVGILGEGLLDAEGTGSRAMPPPPTVASKQSEAAMSAFGGVGNRDVAVPPRGRGKETTPRNQQSNFSVYEDNILCKSWLEISCDPVTNTGQRKESFWGRITARYNSQRGKYPERSQKSISTCWDLIKSEVGKFAGHMSEMIRSNPSGVSDSDKSVAAAANFAAIEKHNFSLMHCWHILKDEPKWLDLKRNMDRLKKSSQEVTPQNSNSNTVDLDPNEERPMGRDKAKAARKKATASYEFASKMHELSVQKMSLFKESEDERKAQLDEIVTPEKVKVEEAWEHRRTMEDLERERLAMDKQRLQMDAENQEKKEDERILAINLDQCLPYQHMYYQTLQEGIIEKLNARRRGRTVSHPIVLNEVVLKLEMESLIT
ncbi:hypothetical protein U9M48_039117 [Paspalum notatum var. saurae]|uniref:No apical meristem-associated C-terminal domain-containing protein n=1 Tax=Paspalum notatum var. saurae TaxID=547442 RepID=A0AAQ3UK21_PASNO